MPPLSTIIPHRGNAPALEATLLSVLENRTPACEVILVHDGSYDDPYKLGDELLIIEEKASNPVALVNAGLMAACSSVICVLDPGTRVEGNWTTAAELIDVEAGVCAVAVSAQKETAISYGISPKAVRDSSLIQRGLVEQKKAEIPSAPTLTAGFYDRRTLLALDGWNDQLAWENADIELAMLMHRLGVRCELSNVCVHTDSNASRLSNNAVVKQMAEVVVAYGLTSAGTSSAMTDLLRGCLSGHISSAVSWATGIMSAARGAKQLQRRIDNAQLNYGQLAEQRQAAAQRRHQRLSAA